MPNDRTFNFNEGCHVTFNDIHDNKDCTIITAEHGHKQPTVSTNESLDDYLTVAYRERQKNNYQHILSIIQDTKWNDKDRARFALALYNSHVMIPANKPKTFRQWYLTFCNIFRFEFHADYTPGKLTPNEGTKQLELYL